jgi:hypothetical protein
MRIYYYLRSTVSNYKVSSILHRKIRREIKKFLLFLSKYNNVNCFVQRGSVRKEDGSWDNTSGSCVCSLLDYSLLQSLLFIYTHQLFPGKLFTRKQIIVKLGKV